MWGVTTRIRSRRVGRFSAELHRRRDERFERSFWRLQLEADDPGVRDAGDVRRVRLSS